MRRSSVSIGGGLLSLVLTVLLLEGGAATIRARQTADAPAFTLETPDTGDTTADGADPVTGPDDPASGKAGREDVDMQGTQTPVHGIEPEKSGLENQGFGDDVVAEPLERIAPRMPLSEAVARPAPEPVVLRHPVALSAGLIRFEDRVLQLDGLLPQSPDRVCDDKGKPWPCGAVARTAFRTWLRARPMLCTMPKSGPKSGWTGTLAARCTVNGMDPAEWLAAHGWAEVVAGSLFEDAVASARTAGRGFFGKDPRAQAASERPSDDPAIVGDKAEPRG